MRVFHGTSFEFGEQIKQHGFGIPSSKECTWVCSDPDVIYFHANQSQYDEEEQLINDRRRYALESGQVTAALHHSASESLYLISLDIPDNFLEDYPDLSCENTDDAIAIPVEILNAPGTKTSFGLTLEVISRAYIPGLAIHYLLWLEQSVLNMDLLSDMERYILKHKERFQDIGDISQFVLEHNPYW